MIRRRYIPKAGGGQRGLGIPDVIDRVVQEAVRQVLEPLWEPTFHPSSHGFRPGRSCHTAIAEPKTQVEDGYEWCVDLDLEKFFDLVCHQRLAAKPAERVSDRRLLGLLGPMRTAEVVLPDGVVIDSEQGVPQGGPLSPLLSNVVLDEFDQELARRGHRFVRQWPRDRVQPNFTSVLTDIAYLRSSEGIVQFTFVIDVISLIVAPTSAAHADAHSSTRRHPSAEQEAG